LKTNMNRITIRSKKKTNINEPKKQNMNELNKPITTKKKT